MTTRYLHRRLRQPRRPVTALTYTGPGGPLPASVADHVKRVWRRSIRNGVVVIDGRDWAITRLPR